jgi:hypothetical protein
LKEQKNISKKDMKDIFNEKKEVFSKYYEKYKTCSKLNNGKIHNCLSFFVNSSLYNRLIAYIVNIVANMQITNKTKV